MKQLINNLLIERNIERKNFTLDVLYLAGMENVKNNIEYYFDKTYSCESVIKELFIRGIIKYIDINNHQ